MKKGFTLVELLAVIVILTIILAIAIPGISNIIDNSRSNSFNVSNKMLMSAAKTYTSVNDIVVADGATTEILYSDIKNAGYISKIVDPISNNECIYSRVYVTNTGGVYTYKSALVCDNYMDIDEYNLVTNSDFSNGTTRWPAWGTSLAVDNNIVSTTGNGSQLNPGIYQTLGLIGATNKKMYSRIKFKINDNQAISTKLILFTNYTNNRIFQSISAPVQNNWYILSGIITLTSLFDGQGLQLFLQTYYADTTTAKDKVMQIDGTVGGYAFDLTTIYGVGNEPTSAQMDNIMKNMGK